jgi:hypothetical protein
MKLWNTVFGRRDDESPLTDETVGRRQSADIGGEYFQVATSPNGRFTVGWRDASPDGSTAGYREAGHGTWVLVDGRSIVARGQLERPNDGHVSDGGRFALTDWHLGDALSSTFYVFGPAGEPLLREHFPVNAGTSAISPDGRFAALYLLANPAERELSNQLICYAVDGPTRLWQQRLPLTWRWMEFDAAAAVLILRPTDAAAVEVRTADGWIDPAQLRSARAASSPYSLVDLVGEEVRSAERVDAELLQRWDAELASADPQFADRPRWRAKVARLRAEVAELRDDPAGALRLYLEALELDPGIGVRKRIEVLSGTKPPPAPRTTSTSVDERQYASAACPTCALVLDPLPQAKKRCPGCGEPVYVRGGPDGRRHLLRDDQLTDHEAWWERERVAEIEASERRQREQAEADRAAGVLVGDYSPELVGESHYQDALRQIATAISPGRPSLLAELVPEPTNPYDRNAVAVLVNGMRVGHLARDDAAEYSRPLQVRRRSGPIQCRVRITGGYDDGRAHFGVVIEGIPAPWEV